MQLNFFYLFIFGGFLFENGNTKPECLFGAQGLNKVLVLILVLKIKHTHRMLEIIQVSLLGLEIY